MNFQLFNDFQLIPNGSGSSTSTASASTGRRPSRHSRQPPKRPSQHAYERLSPPILPSDSLPHNHSRRTPRAPQIEESQDLSDELSDADDRLIGPIPSLPSSRPHQLPNHRALRDDQQWRSRSPERHEHEASMRQAQSEGLQSPIDHQYAKREQQQPDFALAPASSQGSHAASEYRRSSAHNTAVSSPAPNQRSQCERTPRSRRQQRRVRILSPSPDERRSQVLYSCEIYRAEEMIHLLQQEAALRKQWREMVRRHELDEAWPLYLRRRMR